MPSQKAKHWRLLIIKHLKPRKKWLKSWKKRRKMSHSSLKSFARIDRSKVKNSTYQNGKPILRVNHWSSWRQSLLNTRKMMNATLEMSLCTEWWIRLVLSSLTDWTRLCRKLRMNTPHSGNRCKFYLKKQLTLQKIWSIWKTWCYKTSNSTICLKIQTLLMKEKMWQ